MVHKNHAAVMLGTRKMCVCVWGDEAKAFVHMLMGVLELLAMPLAVCLKP